MDIIVIWTSYEHLMRSLLHLIVATLWLIHSWTYFFLYCIQSLIPEIGSASLPRGAITDPGAKCCRAASDLSGGDLPLRTSWPGSPLGPMQSIEEANVKISCHFPAQSVRVNVRVLFLAFQISVAGYRKLCWLYAGNILVGYCGGVYGLRADNRLSAHLK